MVTDHLLVRRAAAELHRALRGARIRDAGLLDDGRFALVAGGRGGHRTLAVAPFAHPPSLALETSELQAAEDPGWARAMGGVLRGLTITAVRARRGDRVIALEFAGRSRFGVASASRLILELIPRFGNVVLLKGETVAAAAKTFSPAENPGRAIELGGAYVPPPLPAPSIGREAFVARLAAGPNAWREALGAYLPQVPRLVAESLALEARALAGAGPEAAAAWFERRAAALDAATYGEAEGLGPVHVYRRDGALVQAHIVALAQYAGDAHEEAPALLPLFAEADTVQRGRTRDDAAERRRDALLRTLRRRLTALEGQLRQIRARREDAASRDLLRRSGEALYTHLAEIPERAERFVPPTAPELTIALDPERDAKANAAEYFTRYRKATDALPHLERRAAELERERDSVEALIWEAERAEPAVIDEVRADAAGLGIVAQQRQARGPARRPRVRALPLPSGARLFVGHSPRENVEITFSLARPDDLWFHARGVPGAHVVLVAADGAPPADDDIRLAAAHAALNSRARAAGKVEVDYTQRKHVRKQRDAAPGMVWYTDFRTILGIPAEAEG